MASSNPNQTVSVNVSALSNALAVAIQQATAGSLSRFLPNRRQVSRVPPVAVLRESLPPAWVHQQVAVMNNALPSYTWLAISLRLVISVARCLHDLACSHLGGFK